MFPRKSKGIKIYENKEKEANIISMFIEITLAVALFVCFWLMVFDSLNVELSDFKWLTGGAPYFASRFMERLTQLTYEIHLGMKSDGNAGQGLFAPAMLVITGILAWLAVYLKNHLILIATAFLILLGMVTGFLLPGIFTAAAVAVIILMVCFKRVRDCACKTSRKNAWEFTLYAVVIISILMMGFLVTGIGENEMLSDLTGSLNKKIHQEKFEKHNNPMPEGRVSEAGAFKPEKTVALQISAGKWETTYLKGYTGERYINGNWERLNGKSASDDAGMFYWLHKDGFYGQSQLADAYDAIGEKPEGFISITAVGACKKYCYLPYGASQEGSRFADSNGIGDLNITVKDPEEASEYIYNIKENAAGNGRSLQKKLKKATSTKDPEVSRYLDDEETYRNYCGKRYLSLPDNLEDTLRICLGEKKKLTPDEAKEAVIDYLEKNIKYNEKTGRVPENKDFISYFLVNSHKGYSIHYASASVMMLRYYGIPARYAEGFIVPVLEDAKSEPSATTTVPMKNSHAWAEYYMEGVGWVPFETVPKYQNSAGKGVDDSREGDFSNQEQKQNEEKKTDNPLNRIGKTFVMNKLLIAALLGILILLFIVWTILRRKKLKKFIDSFRGEDRAQGAANAFAYSLTLIKKSGIDVNRSRLRLSLGNMEEEYRETFERAIEINEEVRYSGEGISEEKRQLMLEFQEISLGLYRKYRKPVLKAIDRIVYCIY